MAVPRMPIRVLVLSAAYLAATVADWLVFRWLRPREQRDAFSPTRLVVTAAEWLALGRWRQKQHRDT